MSYGTSPFLFVTIKFMSTSQKIGGAIIFLSFFAGCVLLFSNIASPKNTPNERDQVFCTMEAKQCSDGSYVGRSGPRCEFDPCPIDQSISSWKEDNDNLEVSFLYPEKLDMKYVRVVSWPPLVSVSLKFIPCTSSKDATQRNKIESRTIGDRTYCVTTENEGAAGSMYTSYSYSFEKNEKYFTLNFSIKSVECSNYDSPEKDQCAKERLGVQQKIDFLINKISNTLIFKEPIELM